METAQMVAEVLGVCIYPEPAIRELTGPSIDGLRGLTMEELRNQ